MSDDENIQSTESDCEKNNVDYNVLFSAFEKFMFALHPQMQDFEENLKKSKK
jgi:hypothetical protein